MILTTDKYLSKDTGKRKYRNENVNANRKLGKLTKLTLNINLYRLWYLNTNSIRLIRSFQGRLQNFETRSIRSDFNFLLFSISTTKYKTESSGNILSFYTIFLSLRVAEYRAAQPFWRCPGADNRAPTYKMFCCI